MEFDALSGLLEGEAACGIGCERDDQPQASCQPAQSVTGISSGHPLGP
jgi:hypothetical protein